MSEDMDSFRSNNENDVFEKVVRAGKRTYFFDVRTTRGNDHYLTITESKRRFNEQGEATYQKHKIFLYKEDFEKFSDALTECFQKIVDLQNEASENLVDKVEKNFNDINFEDLDDSEN